MDCPSVSCAGEEQDCGEEGQNQNFVVGLRELKQFNRRRAMISIVVI